MLALQTSLHRHHTMRVDTASYPCKSPHILSLSLPPPLPLHITTHPLPPYTPTQILRLSIALTRIRVVFLKPGGDRARIVGEASDPAAPPGVQDVVRRRGLAAHQLRLLRQQTDAALPRPHGQDPRSVPTLSPTQRFLKALWNRAACRFRLHVSRAMCRGAPKFSGSQVGEMLCVVTEDGCALAG